MEIDGEQKGNAAKLGDHPQSPGFVVLYDGFKCNIEAFIAQELRWFDRQPWFRQSKIGWAITELGGIICRNPLLLWISWMSAFHSFPLNQSTGCYLSSPRPASTMKKLWTSMNKLWSLVGGLEHFLFSIIYPNWRTHIFQRGRSTTNQIFI